MKFITILILSLNCFSNTYFCKYDFGTKSIVVNKNKFKINKDGIIYLGNIKEGYISLKNSKGHKVTFEIKCTSNN